MSDSASRMFNSEHNKPVSRMHLVQNDRRAMPLQEEGGILLRLLGLARQVEGDKAVVRKEPPKG